MKISKIRAIYISPTGNVKTVVRTIAEKTAKLLDVPVKEDDFTLPDSRSGIRKVPADELVIFGVPVYSGRVPNKFLPFIQQLYKSDGAPAVPVVCFGNRNFDNALIELRNELENNGFRTVAGAGAVTEHVFSDALAPGRPDAKDIRLLEDFASDIVGKIKNMEPSQLSAPIAVRGDDPVGPYYKPLGIDGKPAVFLKAKPKTKETLCIKCGICIKSCPMGSISEQNPSNISGICIKCHACVKKCPQKAKYFDDPAFISHVKMLEANYTKASKTELFL